ncbi:MAG: 5'-3' exonuclease H3TH domain-containing protein [Candidatus Peribacteraceae bacterium]|nr:5'-3' exonuclease H3TH domain-containing protein [Candidatus Peribacteraceae bacterium]
MQQHLVLIDGHHLMYRAFYAIPATMRTAKGEQTNAVYGVASMLLAILKIEQPDALLFCFDAGDKTFRHQENATYKDGRAETPDEFYLQIPRILEMIDAFGFKHVADGGFEADDFLCTYAVAAEKAGMRVTIVTGDRDAFQLATDSIRVAIPHKGYQQTEYLGPREIETKYGVTPAQIPSYKGLVGDASDNLPGVLGIGPKTAATLLQQYGTLAGVYEHLADIKETVRAKLEKDREQAFFCERMATLICDIPLPCSLDDLALRDMPVEPVARFFREVEFAALQKRLDSLLRTPYGSAHFLVSAVSAPAVAVGREEDQLSLF